MNKFTLETKLPENVEDGVAYFECFECKARTRWRLLPKDLSNPGVRCCSFECMEAILAYEALEIAETIQTVETDLPAPVAHDIIATNEPIPETDNK